MVIPGGGAVMPYQCVPWGAVCPWISGVVVIELPVIPPTHVRVPCFLFNGGKFFASIRKEANGTTPGSIDVTYEGTILRFQKHGDREYHQTTFGRGIVVE